MKHYYLSIFLAILLSMACAMASAHDIAVANSDGKTIYYNYNRDGSSLTVTYQGTSSSSYYDEYIGEIVIPETVTYDGETYSVTSIGDDAFKNCSGLTSVTIPNNVTSIGEEAFYGCLGLTLVTIPNSVTSIGSFAFKGTAWYDNQPDGLVYVGNVAYGYKGTMPDNTSITLKEGTVGISSAFVGCSGLTSVTIPNSVTSIGALAFSGCSGLTSVTIPNSVTSICNRAFQDCSSLTSVVIPNSVTSIGHYAFDGCSGLTSIVIPNSVTSIGSGAFIQCSSLTSVTIPNSVTSISSQTFSHCISLTSVTIPNSVVSIDHKAFEGCYKLTSITIPNSVTTIGQVVFGRCLELTKIEVDKGNSVYDSRNDCNAIIETASNTIIAGCKNTIIPNSVTGIGRNAFYGCSRLTSVTIPNSVTSIGERAFNASGLTSVTIPGSVTSIGYYAFQGCSKLTSVISEIKQPFTLYAHACSFDYISNQCVLTVPVGKRDAYIAKGWTTDVFQGGIVEETNLYCGYCGDGVMYTYDETTKTLTIEGNNAMADYSDPSLCPWYSYRGDIQTVVIKDGVTSIGVYAFDGCSGLTSVIIPNSVTSIGGNAFNNCSGLTKVIVPNFDIKNWCSIRFGNYYANPLYYAHHLYSDENTEITKLVIPDGVTSIGPSAFVGCSGLTSVTIPNSVTNIGSFAFENCSGLTSVTIPNSVTSIGSYAFRSCSGLTSVKVMRKEPPTIEHRFVLLE